MTNPNCPILDKLENRFFSPKEALLDQVFQKNLLESTKVTSTSLNDSGVESNFSYSTLRNLRKLLSSDVQSLGSANNELSEKDLIKEQTDMLLSLLVSGVNMKIEETESLDTLVDEFTCAFCLELLNNPVTFTCGHSACKNCASKATNCKSCNYKLENTSSLCVNVLLSSILENIFPFKYVGMNLTKEGDELMQRNQIREAISKYTEAMQLIPQSHTVYEKRAKAYTVCKNLELALQDSERLGSLARKLPKTYFIKGEILQSLGMEEDALLNFLLSAALDPSHTLPMKRAQSIVTKIISGQINVQYSPSITKRAISEDCDQTVRKKSKITSQIGNSNSHCTSSGSKSSRSNSSDIPSSSKSGPSNSGGSSTDSKRQNDLFSSVMEIIENLSTCIVSDFQSMSLTQDSEDNAESLTDPNAFDKDFSALDAGDFECSLCMRLFFEPVCTPCGHLFCKRCLERTLDHGTQCPLCKANLQSPPGKEIFHPLIDKTSEAIIKRFLPLEYDLTLQQHEEEMKKLKETIPIFVCTLAFPSVACPLHIYEPRYRLMLRRVLDIHNKEFGMCLHSDTEQFQQVGTLLRVEKASFFHDGRSVVQSVGTKRFSIINKDTVDGYHSAHIEYIVDEPVENPEELEKLKKLMNIVYLKGKQWFTGLKPQIKDEITKHFGEYPSFQDSMGDNGPDWSWWILAVLPVENKIKLTILGKKRLRDRLLLINRIVACLVKKQAQQQV